MASMVQTWGMFALKQVSLPSQLKVSLLVHCSKAVTLLLHVSFAGMFAIRAERDYVIDEDFMKGVRKVADNKKLESKLDYKPV